MQRAGVGKEIKKQHLKCKKNKGGGGGGGLGKSLIQEKSMREVEAAVQRKGNRLCSNLQTGDCLKERCSLSPNLFPWRLVSVCHGGSPHGALYIRYSKTLLTYTSLANFVGVRTFQRLIIGRCYLKDK